MRNDEILNITGISLIFPENAKLFMGVVPPIKSLAFSGKISDVTLMFAWGGV
jgi:hypothetical protein